jgi:A/G-specific adenine glycosylase
LNVTKRNEALSANAQRLSKHRNLSVKQISSFRSTVYQYYENYRRDLPWRNTDDPYRILVSEIMLQQTRVERVIDKYDLFVSKFPDFPSLAKAPLKEVLNIWQGLGYNRRVLWLVKLAQIVVSQYHGRLPVNIEALTGLPGIGRATAGCMLAFAFHEPSVFIETNIRRVFIHHIFQDREDVHDREIMPLVETTLDRSNPREWYYSLMDYGSMLKKEIENPNKKSAHYTRQSPFKDSDRKIRGIILKTLLQRGPLSERDIAVAIHNDRKRAKKILSALVKEGFIELSSNLYIP